MKQITIQIPDDKPDKCGIQISPELTCTEAFQMLGTLALHMLNAYTTVAISALNQNHNSGSTPSASKLSTDAELRAATTGIKESMYDAMNSVFSTVLQNYYPDAVRYSIEDEAILQLTNNLIEERYNKLTPAEQKAYSKAYQSLKASVTQDLKDARSKDNGSGDGSDNDNESSSSKENK